MATVVLLNGVGSVGKSSIAKAVQGITAQECAELINAALSI